MRTLTLVFGLLAIAAVAGTSLGEYTIDRWSINSGAGNLRNVSSTCEYSLQSSTGQDLAGVIENKPFVLNSGFLSGSTGCIINLTDLAIFAQDWLSADPSSIADLNGDGITSLKDFAILAQAWLCQCPEDWQLK